MQNAIAFKKIKIDWITTSYLLVCHTLAIAAFWHITPGALVSCFLLYILTVLGITLGYHRHFTHHGLKLAAPAKYFFALCGTLAMQGPLGLWVADHRLHHKHSDKDGDPHNANRGFWFCHMGWIVFKPTLHHSKQHRSALIKDILADPVLRFMSTYAFMIGSQLVLAFLLWYLGGIPALLWGGFMRLVLVYHATWLVNSAAHFWGYRRYPSNDRAKNNWVVALLALGEGWHNNHHRYASLARHGHAWYEFDFTYGIIRLLEALGLATKVQKNIPQQKTQSPRDSAIIPNPAFSQNSTAPY